MGKGEGIGEKCMERERERKREMGRRKKGGKRERHVEEFETESKKK